ncbi:MAG: formylglycine-generating enzyme family protein [Deltaproteobacteria bacterium]|nr:MAG: formylglycine-generating enzyme family protein [Deltaproteobacteria bacterium]
MAERPSRKCRRWEPNPATRSSGQFPARTTPAPITTSVSRSPSPTSGSSPCARSARSTRTPEGARFRPGRLSCFDAPVRVCAIPAGEFWMGSDAPEGQDNERPRRRVATGAYSIGETPVTNGEFDAFVGGGGYRDRGVWSDAGWQWREANAVTAPRFWNEEAWRDYLGPDQPVVGVSWYEADAFARSLGMRLPTEAEWERAARGEDGRRFPWGDEWVPENAAHRGGRRHTLPVRSIPENRSPHGLYDCAGNVWEWCADAYAEGLRSARGGSWNAHPPQLRCAARNAWAPDARFSNLGFRVAR